MRYKFINFSKALEYPITTVKFTHPDVNFESVVIDKKITDGCIKLQLQPHNKLKRLIKIHYVSGSIVDLFVNDHLSFLKIWNIRYDGNIIHVWSCFPYPLNFNFTETQIPLLENVNFQYVYLCKTSDDMFKYKLKVNQVFQTDNKICVFTDMNDLYGSVLGELYDYVYQFHENFLPITPYFDKDNYLGEKLFWECNISTNSKEYEFVAYRPAVKKVLKGIETMDDMGCVYLFDPSIGSKMLLDIIDVRILDRMNDKNFRVEINFSTINRNSRGIQRFIDDHTIGFSEFKLDIPNQPRFSNYLWLLNQKPDIESPYIYSFTTKINSFDDIDTKNTVKILNYNLNIISNRPNQLILEPIDIFDYDIFREIEDMTEPFFISSEIEEIRRSRWYLHEADTDHNVITLFRY